MARGPKFRTTNLTMEDAARRAEVVEYRRQRLSFAEIGRRMNITGQRAGQLYRMALAAVPAQAVEEHRVEELGLIDDAINDLLIIARNHDMPRTAVEAWSSIRGWAERKAKLLGLDAPLRAEVVTLDHIDAEISRLERELAADADRDEVGEAGAVAGVAGGEETPGG